MGWPTHSCVEMTARSPRRSALESPDELEVLGIDVPARVLSAAELVAWRPEGELGDSANVLLAIRDLAERSVSEGLVHPRADARRRALVRVLGRDARRADRGALSRVSGGAPCGVARSTSTATAWPWSTTSTRGSSTRSRAPAGGRRRSARRPVRPHTLARARQLPRRPRARPIPSCPSSPTYTTLERSGSRNGSTTGSAGSSRRRGARAASRRARAGGARSWSCGCTPRTTRR